VRPSYTLTDVGDVVVTRIQQRSKHLASGFKTLQFSGQTFSDKCVNPYCMFSRRNCEWQAESYKTSVT
jgi:hypothetical protein